MDTTTYIVYTLTLSNRNVPALRVLLLLVVYVLENVALLLLYCLPGMDDRHHSGVEIRWRPCQQGRSSRVLLDDVSPRHPARAWQLCDVVLHSFAGVKDAR